MRACSARAGYVLRAYSSKAWSVPGLQDRYHCIIYYITFHSSTSKYTWYLAIFFSPLFFHCVYYSHISALVLSRSLPVATQIRGYIPGPPSPSRLTRTVRAFIFYRKKSSALSSLVNSRRIVRTRALTVSFFFFFF